MGENNQRSALSGHSINRNDHVWILRNSKRSGIAPGNSPRIQDETHGFTELVPLSYLHTNTPLYNEGISRAGATGREDLLMIAVSRLFLDNFDNIQVS